METRKWETADQLLSDEGLSGSLHIECNQAAADRLYEALRRRADAGSTAWLLQSDKGYERESVRRYLKMFAALNGAKSPDMVMEQFGLQSIAGRKLVSLNQDQSIRVQIARISMQQAQTYYLEEPLLNLDGRSTGMVLEWIARRTEEGARFITTNASMRHALLMPGHVFYMEKEMFREAPQEDDEAEVDDELHILKIAAKSGRSTLLFEPKDIDYAESLNKSNYIFVRGTSFLVSQTMDELEQLLVKSGFFRCHRSYLVNMQKVEQLEKLTKNSYALVLEDERQSRIPLSKGRLDAMKEMFGW